MTNHKHWILNNQQVILPGVIQLESNLASVGRVSPFSNAFFILSSASFADLKQNSIGKRVENKSSYSNVNILSTAFRQNIVEYLECLINKKGEKMNIWIVWTYVYTTKVA